MITKMSNTSHDTKAASMKGLVAAAAMMADEGNTNGEPNQPDIDQAIPKIMMAAVPLSKSRFSTSSKATTENEASESSSDDDDDDDDRGVVKKSGSAPTSEKTKAKDFLDVHVARARRLEQNRRAAIESRRRKKVMIAELQRSVTFYTKANKSLKVVNLDLEQRLFLARQRVLSKQRVQQALDVSREESSMSHDPSKKSISFEQSQNAKQPLVASVATVSLPPMHVSGSPVRTDQSHALTYALTLPSEPEYPPDDQILLRNSIYHLIGRSGVITSKTCSTNTYTFPVGPSLDAKQSSSDTIASQLPSEEEVGGDKYLESLRKVRL
jgi:hypothetical protein